MLLKYPSLLAHTIYETLAFDASMSEEGFSLEGTSAAKDGETKWEGLIDVVLGNADWFETWLAAEKECASSTFDTFVSSLIIHNIVVDDQYNTIFNDPDAWDVSEEMDTDGRSRDLRSTVSSRRIRSLIEQVTGKLRLSVLPTALISAQTDMHLFQELSTSPIFSFQCNFLFWNRIMGE